jgi:hypothetical protein
MLNSDIQQPSPQKPPDPFCRAGGVMARRGCAARGQLSAFSFQLLTCLGPNHFRTRSTNCQGTRHKKNRRGSQRLSCLVMQALSGNRGASHRGEGGQAKACPTTVSRMGAACSSSMPQGFPTWGGRPRPRPVPWPARPVSEVLDSSTEQSGTGASRADQGVRPTINAESHVWEILAALCFSLPCRSVPAVPVPEERLRLIRREARNAR